MALSLCDLLKKKDMLIKLIYQLPVTYLLLMAIFTEISGVLYYIISITKAQLDLKQFSTPGFPFTNTGIMKH